MQSDRSADKPQSEGELLRWFEGALASRLPSNWTLVTEKEVGSRAARADAILSVTASTGETVRLVVEAKGTLERRDVSSVIEQVERYVSTVPGGVPVVIARYLAPTVREALAERGVSYADATANMRVQALAPAMFVSDRGADKNPWRTVGRPRGSLKGEPASRVVRALVDVAGPIPVRELVALSGASTGATYRVLEYLAAEELIRREDKGPVVVPDWRRLLEQWSRDYGFLRSNLVRRFIEPRGVPALLDKIRDLGDGKYAVTASVAASRWAPYAEVRNVMAYVEDVGAFADLCGLRATDTGANVLLAEPESNVVFERTMVEDGLVAVAPSQAAVDLLTGPGRSPAEAEALLDWMAGNESSWRR